MIAKTMRIISQVRQLQLYMIGHYHYLYLVIILMSGMIVGR